MREKKKHNLLISTNIPNRIHKRRIFLDTNCFIIATKRNDFSKGVLLALSSNDNTLFTIPSVVFEFTRSSNNASEYNERLTYVERSTAIYPIERHALEFSEYVPVIQSTSRGASYTDFLLGICLIKFPESILITENHKDFPISIYNRIGSITIEYPKGFKNMGLYTIDSVKLTKAKSNIERRK